MINKEKIHKLMSSSNWEDQILGMHFLSEFSWKDLLDMFNVGEGSVGITLDYILKSPHPGVYYTVDKEILFYSAIHSDGMLIRNRSLNYARNIQIINI